METITLPFHRPEPNPAAMISTLQSCSHLLQRILAHHFGEFDLTDIRYEVLRAITTTPDCTQSRLADRLHQSESSISTLVERMRKDGLLFRLASESDRRKRVLILSEKGQSLLAQVETCHRERMTKLLGELSDSEQVQLTDLLTKLHQSLGGVADAIDNKMQFPWPADRMAA